MKRIGIWLLALALLPLAAATAQATHGECDDYRVTGLVSCAAGDGYDLADTTWGKYAPLNPGAHCLPFTGYNYCS